MSFVFCSVAILQYLAERYKVDDKFYPMEPQLRAVINHRLAFYLSTYYSSIAHYVVCLIIDLGLIKEKEKENIILFIAPSNLLCLFKEPRRT
jgi:glutathione S-transferase